MLCKLKLERCECDKGVGKKIDSLEGENLTAEVKPIKADWKLSLYDLHKKTLKVFLQPLRLFLSCGAQTADALFLSPAQPQGQSARTGQQTSGYNQQYFKMQEGQQM